MQTEYGVTFTSAAMRKARKVAGSAPFAQTAKVVDMTDHDVRTAAFPAALGTSVAISEDQSTMVIGAPNDYLDASGANYASQAGAVYVYIKSGGVWTFQQKLSGMGTNGRNSNDHFGSSVAISGDTIVVGVPDTRYDSTGAAAATSSGAAFVFLRSGGIWSLQQKISATGTNASGISDQYGTSVSISGDLIAIGSPGQRYDEVGGGSQMLGAGAVFMYSRSGSTWTQDQKIVAQGTAGTNRAASDNFGNSVSLNGSSMIVGAPSHAYDSAGANSVAKAGAAFIYARSAGTWSFQQKIAGGGSGTSRAVNDAFGTSVAINGTTVAIGTPGQDYDDVGGGTAVGNSGGVFIYTFDSVTWNFQQKVIGTGTNGRISTDAFGTSVGLSGDTLVVGTPAQDYNAAGASSLTDAGAAYVFLRTGSTWALQTKYVGTGTYGRFASDKLGTGVAVSGDTLIAGAPGHTYDETNTYSPITGAGAAYAVERSGSTWTQAKILVDMTSPSIRMGDSGATYGSAIAVSNDQTTLVIGAPTDSTDSTGANYLNGAGAAFVYTKSGSAWVLQQKIVATGTNARIAGDGFGKSVAIYNDTIIVGANAHGYDASGANLVAGAGAAFIYTRSAGVWSLQQKIVGSGTNGRLASDSFGQVVSISGDTVAVGAPLQDYDPTGTTTATNAGAIFVYTRSGSTWSFQQKLILEGTPGRQSSDNFGTSLSLDGDTIAAGAPTHPYDDAGSGWSTSAGAAAIYTRTGGVWTFQQKLSTVGRYTYMFFGNAIGLSGDTVVVGCKGYPVDIDNNSGTYRGSAFVYTRSGSTWTLQQRLGSSGTNAHIDNDYFGAAVAISGNTVAVGSANTYDATGANTVTGAGAIWVYKRSGSTWSQSQKLVPTGTNARIANDYFAYLNMYNNTGIGLSGDVMAVGSSGQDYDSSGGRYIPDAGAAFVFTR